MSSYCSTPPELIPAGPSYLKRVPYQSHKNMTNIKVWQSQRAAWSKRPNTQSVTLLVSYPLSQCSPPLASNTPPIYPAVQGSNLDHHSFVWVGPCTSTLPPCIQAKAPSGPIKKTFLHQQQCQLNSQQVQFHVCSVSHCTNRRLYTKLKRSNYITSDRTSTI